MVRSRRPQRGSERLCLSAGARKKMPVGRMIFLVKEEHKMNQVKKRKQNDKRIKRHLLVQEVLVR